MPYMHARLPVQAPAPDINALHALSSAINLSTEAAERAFAELLQLNGQSLVVLRLYAEFELFVANNADKSGLLFAEAERLEEQQQKEHQRETGAKIRIMEQSNIDVMAGLWGVGKLSSSQACLPYSAWLKAIFLFLIDNTAVISIGGGSHNLGKITSSNAYASRLFGYTRW
jgi:hypothetical protein